MDQIAGKVIVITGASSGIGAATAALLAARGARLALGARRVGPLVSLAERLANAGAEVVHIATDVSKRGQVEALVNLAVDCFGDVDVIVNNAGIAPTSLLDELSVGDWEAIIDVNLKGVLYGIAAVLPHFRRRKSGHIINICSTAARRVMPTMAVYAASKAAVLALSEGLRQEAGHDMRVTVVSPGFTRTNLPDSIGDATVRAQIAAMAEQIGMPAEAVARAILFAIEQPRGVDIGEIVLRPTAQS